MKLFIVLTLFVCCAYSQLVQETDPKRDLLQRVAELETRIKGTLQKLKDEHREHLAQAIKEEANRLESLANDLKNSDKLNPQQLKRLEDSILRISTRLSIEERALETEMREQTKILDDANILLTFTDTEIKKLETIVLTLEGQLKQQCQEAINALKDEEKRLKETEEELKKAQTIERIAELEVKLRAIEAALYETLILLGFDVPTHPPPTHTP